MINRGYVGAGLVLLASSLAANVVACAPSSDQRHWACGKWHVVLQAENATVGDGGKPVNQPIVLKVGDVVMIAGRLNERHVYHIFVLDKAGANLTVNEVGVQVAANSKAHKCSQMTVETRL